LVGIYVAEGLITVCPEAFRICIAYLPGGDKKSICKLSFEGFG
jgi:hypothetical protein